MNKSLIKIVFFLAAAISINAFCIVNQISENFYTARIPGKNLSLVMERIDHRTHPLWSTYIEVQSNPRVIDRAGGSTGEGSNHFKMVLNEVDYQKNEVWVAYISKSTSPQPIPDYFMYSASDVDGARNPFAREIEMFVTVSSSPTALLTSHMGIASTAESAQIGRAKGTSVDLHSFAAKVMLMRNPGRRYMVNAPAMAMRDIIIKALPAFTFIGTKEMLNIILERQAYTFADFKRENEASIRKEIEERCQKEINHWHYNIKQTLSYMREGQTEESIRQDQNKRLDSCLIVGKDGNPVFNQETISQSIEKSLAEKFTNFKLPFLSANLFTYTGTREENGQAFLNLMKDHPPILSVDGEGGAWIKNQFTIFSDGQPWLTVKKGNKNYQWMFSRPFAPAGITSFMAVDLQALARSKPVE